MEQVDTADQVDMKERSKTGSQDGDGSSGVTLLARTPRVFILFDFSSNKIAKPIKQSEIRV